MIDHVTYEVPKGALHPGKTGELADFFGALELDEVPPDPVIEKGWNVRWWTDGDGKFQIHLVEGEKEGWSGWRLGLAHFCVIVSLTGYELLRGSQWLERDSGSGRIWLTGPYGLRVEVRPAKSLPASVAREEASVRSSAAEQAHGRVLERAAAIFAERNAIYKDNWRRYGWRGCLYDLRRKVERAWDALWDADAEVVEASSTPGEVGRMYPSVDDLLDVINYAATAVRAVEEGNRDGKGRWWGS